MAMPDDMPAEKQLPQNVEAEAGTLGSLLIDPQAIVEIIDLVAADDFYREANREIFQVYLDKFAVGEPVDLITLTDELTRRGRLDEIGGASYVSSLANQVPTSANIEHYAQIVARTAQNRRRIHAAGQLAAAAYDEDETAIEQAQQQIFDISTSRDAGARAQRFEAVLGEYVNDLFDRQDKSQDEIDALLGVPIGFRDWERLVRVWRPGDFILLAARPSDGKTTLALSLAYNAACAGKRVAIFSMEMAATHLAESLLALAAGIDTQHLSFGRLSDEESARVSNVVGQLTALDLIIDDTPGLTITELRSRARRLAMTDGIDLVVIDYVQLLHGSAATTQRRELNRVQELTEISQGLKQLARELDVPVLALSQLSRAVESRNDKRPMLSDLAESGSLERDADVIQFIYRHEKYFPDTDKQNIADIIVAKQRRGPTGTFSLYFDKQHSRFINLESGRAEPERVGVAAGQSNPRWWNEG